ncbi:MAG: glycosyltransferase family 2 protein [Flavobacteriales bacterium]
MQPRISIITPSFQQREYLEECLRSVREQDYAQLEHIVVDGGSTDGSHEVLQRHGEQLAWWCCEPDRGQSDAINKGLSRCTGDLVAWLNSDDLLLPGALRAVARAYEQAPGSSILEGARMTLTADGTQERMPENDPADPDTLFIAPHVNQQATFYRTAAVKAVGGVDEALHFTMDLDLWWRVLFAHGPATFTSIPQELAVFRLQPASKTMQGPDAFVRETAAILQAAAARCGLSELACMLRLGHPDLPGVRPSNAREEHAPLVERMIVRFMLKWNGTIANADRFHMLKRLDERYGTSPPVGDPVLLERWQRMRKGLSAPGWKAYRLGRKLGLWSA